MAQHSTKSTRRHETLKGVFNRFASETSAPGLPRLIDRKGFLWKILWLTFLMLAFAAFVYQTVELLQDYYAFNTNINLINSQEVAFPAVTVCNLNRMRHSALRYNDRWIATVQQDKCNVLGVCSQQPQSGRPSYIPPTPPDYPTDSSSDIFPTGPDATNGPQSIRQSYSDYFHDSTPDSNFPSGQDATDGRIDKREWERQRQRRDTPDDDYQWSYDSLGHHEEGQVSSYDSPGLQEDEQVSESYSFDYGSMSVPGVGVVPENIWKPDMDIPDPTKEELRVMGHQAEDFILDCKFNNRKCDHRDFTVTQKKHYGNCFTFNGDTTDISSQNRVTKAGSDYGLHLTMFIEHDEYVRFLTEEAGVRVMTHQRSIMPHPEDVAMSVPPGTSTNIALRQVVIKRLPEPYGNCTLGDGGHKYLDQEHYSYNIISCQKKCFFDNLAAGCGCVTEIYDEYKHLPQCTRTQRVCRQLLEGKYYGNLLGCNCPAPCEEIVYNTQASASQWPTEGSFFYLRDKLREKSEDVYDRLPDVITARENLVRIKVYFQELNYESVEQVPANSVPSMLGTIGGLLGLYLGFCLITVGEVSVLLYDIVKLFCRRIYS